MRAAFQLVLAVSVGAWTLPNVQAAEDPDVIAEKQWDKDKEQYRRETEKLRQEVVEQLTALEDKARDRGDAAKVKRIKAELEAFEETGEFPTSVERVTYNKKRKAADEELRQNFKKVQAALLKAKRDRDADDAEKELAELLVGTTSTEKSEPSSVKPGDDVRTKWINTSYASTIYRVDGKKWAEAETNTRKIKWYLQETARTAEYIEVVNQTRKETWRIFKDSVELRTGNSWKNIAAGHWEVAPK